MARLILDTGAIIGLVRGDARVAAALRIATERGDEVVIPSVVVAQAIRGGPRDAPIHRLLHAVRVSFVGLRLARQAGELLGATGMNDAVDALVMAEALRGGPSVILTSDTADMARLAGHRQTVRIVQV
ncbi:MAG: PIN domain-containing protein [Actinomycetota bacterium]|nr:PIN domain-containing protein [Actinomycetota bacterium]